MWCVNRCVVRGKARCFESFLCLLRCATALQERERERERAHARARESEREGLGFRERERARERERRGGGSAVLHTDTHTHTHKGAVAAVLCCNASDVASFHHLKDWVDQVRLVCGPSVSLSQSLLKKSNSSAIFIYIIYMINFLKSFKVFE